MINFNVPSESFRIEKFQDFELLKLKVTAYQLQFVCLLYGHAKSGELSETVRAIFPPSVLIISQKGTVAQNFGIFMPMICICTHFVCANFSEAESTFVLILTLFTCLLL